MFKARELNNSSIVIWFAIWFAIFYNIHACQLNVFYIHMCISNCPSINTNGLERNRMQGAYSYHSTLTLCSMSVGCTPSVFLETNFEQPCPLRPGTSIFMRYFYKRVLFVISCKYVENLRSEFRFLKLLLSCGFTLLFRY